MVNSLLFAKGRMAVLCQRGQGGHWLISFRIFSFIAAGMTQALSYLMQSPGFDDGMIQCKKTIGGVDMRKTGLSFSLLTAAAAVLAVSWQGEALGRGYAFNDNMAISAANTLTALLAVTLFVERGMSAINAILFGDRQRIAEKQIVEGSEVALDNLADVLANKERLRLLGAFIAGLFVSAAGVRTLEGLLKIGTTPTLTNHLLVPVDVVLTASLIAGGSNGLAFLLQLAKDLLADGAAPHPGDGLGIEEVPGGTASRGEYGVVHAQGQGEFVSSVLPMKRGDIRRARARMTTTG